MIPLATALWGVQASLMVPSLALILVGMYAATPVQLGWVMTITNSAGFVASLAIPALADRRARYLQFLLASAVLSIGLGAGLALAHDLVAGTLVLALIGAPAGVGNSLLFAHMNHSGFSRADVMRTRAVFSLAWVVGPPLVTAQISALGIISVPIGIMIIAGLNALTSLILLVRSRPTALDVERPTVDLDDPPRRTRLGAFALALVFLAFALAQATNTATITITTLLVTDHMGLPILWAGLALGAGAGLEVPVLMIQSRIVDRFSTVSLLVTGCLVGVAYYVGMAIVTAPIPLLLLQALKAWFYGTMIGVGMTWFSEVVPRSGLAMGLYANTGRIGSVLAGLLVGAAVQAWGYAGIFAVSAVVVGASALLIAGVGGLQRRRARSDRKNSPAPVR